MKKSIILFFALLWSFSVSAQIQWQKSLGGTGWDGAYSIIQTYDSGYIVAGISASGDGDVTGNHGGNDYWVVKVNKSGTIQWKKALGGGQYDQAISIIQTYDSGYIVTGYSESNNGDVTGNHGGIDYWVVKLNTSGTIQWQKSLGGTSDDYASSIVQTWDSGYVVAGWSMSNNGDVTGNQGGADYWVVKLNSTGTIQWQQSLGGTLSDLAYSVIQSTDSGYVVAGWSMSNNGDVTGNQGGADYWVVKLTTSGTIQWQKSLGGTSVDQAYSILQTLDSGYIVSGYSRSNNGDVTGNHGDFDYWVVKLNSAATIEWQKSLGGTNADYANSIIQTSDSGYLVAGSTYSNNGDVTGNHGVGDYWVVKLDTSGILQWQKSLGGTDDDRAFSINQKFNNGYVLAGYSQSNNGDVTGNHGNADYWVVKFIDTALTVSIAPFGSIENQISVYPNPSTDNFSIPANSEFDNAQLNIFNAMGCNVYSCRLTREARVIATENFSSGIYYVQIIKGEKMWGEKIIKQ